jgi:flagellar hook-length control protein FliK
MRIFVLPSLSTNVITASNNAAKLPAKSNATDAKHADDGSPFGVMLAATAAQQAKQKPAKLVSGDEHQAAAKKSNTASNEASATREHRDAAKAGKTDTAKANAGKANTAKEADGKTRDTKSADAKSADASDKAATKDTAANDNADTAAQTSQPQIQQPPIQQAQVQQAQVPPPAPQPDQNALMLAQAQAAAPPLAGATAANSAAGAGTDIHAIGTDAGNASSVASTLAGSAIPNAAQTIADGTAPSTPGASSKTMASSSGNFKSQLAALKGAADDGKTSATQGSEKAASQTDTAAQPQAQQTQQAQALATSQTPPPAAPANNDNVAAVPALNFGAPVQNNAAATVSSSIQVSAHAADTAGTVGTLAVSIAAKTQSGARQFNIRLDPPELGHVEVRLSIDANGKTEAHMTADHPETLSLLQKDSSSLTQALRDAGLDVSQSGLNFSLRSQNGQGGSDNGGTRSARNNLTASRAIDAAQGASSASSFTGGISDGRLDIHV